MRLRPLALAATAVLSTACAGPTAPEPAQARDDVAASSYVGVWTRPDGRPAEAGEGQDRTFELASRPLPEHCGWETAVVLDVPQPVGSTYAIGSAGVLRSYVRDAAGVLPEAAGAFRGELDLHAELPDGSTATGYRLREVELWFGRDGGEEYAYLVRPGGTERWPVAVEDVVCA